MRKTHRHRRSLLPGVSKKGLPPPRETQMKTVYIWMDSKFLVQLTEIIYFHDTLLPCILVKRSQSQKLAVQCSMGKKFLISVQPILNRSLATSIQVAAKWLDRGLSRLVSLPPVETNEGPSKIIRSFNFMTLGSEIEFLQCLF